MSLGRSQTDQRAESDLAVYERAFLDLGAREGIPNFSRSLRLNAHLLHELVEEVFSFRVGMGLEPVLEVAKHAFDFVVVQGQ